MQAQTLYEKLFESHIVREDAGTYLIYIDRHLVQLDFGQVAVPSYCHSNFVFKSVIYGNQLVPQCPYVKAQAIVNKMHAEKSVATRNQQA